MKKLGLIGGTGPESTIVYYRELTQGVAKRSGGVFPYMTIESLSVVDVLRYCAEDDLQGLADYLAAGFEHLGKSGVDFAALTGITVHIVMDELKKKSPVPIISMMDVTRDYAAAKGYKKLALMGTQPTMEKDFFKKPFWEKGIEIVTPEAEDLMVVGNAIENELEYGQVKPDTVARLTAIAHGLIEKKGAQALILGCTELPLAFENVTLPVEKIDVMRLHIARLTDLILE